MILLPRASTGPRQIVRLFLIEPRRIVVDALRHVYALDPALLVVGDSRTVDRALIAQHRPDVIVMDLDALALPIEEAIDACESASPQSRVCVLSSQHRTRVMQRALAAKAAAYVVKDTAPATMVEIINSVARGDYYADPRLAGRQRPGRPGSTHPKKER